MALVCGDAFHNLRTALDYLVGQLGIADSGKVSDRIAFPIVMPGHGATWPSVAGDRLALLSDEHVEAIRLLQPFVDASDNSTNVMLAAMGTLDNRDKHRLLLLVTAAAHEGTFTFSPSARGVELETEHKGPVPLDRDCELFRLRAASVPGGMLNIRAQVHIGVQYGGPDGPTVEALIAAADAVAGVIGSFELDIRRDAQASLHTD